MFVKDKTNEKDHVFPWLCLNEVGDYYLFLRVCELGNHYCVVKTEKGFDITVDVRENAVLINDMKNWVLNRRMIKEAVLMDMILMKIFHLIRFISFKSWTTLKHVLKKKFQNFREKVLPKVLECGLCEKYSRKWHKQFLLICSQCREVRFSPCVTLESEAETLIKTLERDGREYVQNFIVDFLQIRDETLNNLFKIETILSESGTKLTAFDVKVYYKSEENRSQVVKETLNDPNKIDYMNKGRNVLFIKKFDYNF